MKWYIAWVRKQSDDRLFDLAEVLNDETANYWQPHQARQRARIERKLAVVFAELDHRAEMLVLFEERPDWSMAEVA